ncbi:hypothetical protein SAMD00019534_049390 [Acytostelium subglobosum LB1]|uniref:hypothetical protein n=1 Tax=Acytostelium subglobosum LB1 TaxID=1410327 RepID=UPI000644CE7C|nr:hypothetical protein SAMD00019534_049390 [Acytostelium subglobosum LB1]GAM21764.1 hypothetical protein SAMD00019534_049390 [Acytostelium subglobosum LB1]|eukprot:XP_012754864.1 hypothetical protein SAMD00019534_049390 [Acytostelium subglobosum LB1]
MTDIAQHIDRFKQTLGMSNIRKVTFRNAGEVAGSFHPFSERHVLCKEISDVLNELVNDRKVELTLYQTLSPSIELRQANLSRINFLRSEHRFDLLRHHLPTSLKSLSLPPTFKGSLDNVLPDGLETLNLVSSLQWNKPITEGSLPSSLQTLKLSSSFNQVIEAHSLPLSLKSITFGWSFNHPLNGVLPPSLTFLDLTLTRGYSHDLMSLPQSVTSIQLPLFFQQALDHPPLQRLQVHSHVPHGHPFPRLEKLAFSYLMDSTNFDASLFPNIARLSIYDGDMVLDLSKVQQLSGTLKHCRLNRGGHPAPMLAPIPFGVTKLALAKCDFAQTSPYFRRLPSSITRLELRYPVGLKPGDIPHSVTSLSIKHDTLLDVNVLPISVTDLTLNRGAHDKGAIINQLPTTIGSITLELTLIGGTLNLIRLDDRHYFRHGLWTNYYGFIDKDTLPSMISSYY